MAGSVAELLGEDGLDLGQVDDAVRAGGPTTTVSAVETRMAPAAPTIGARVGHTRPSSKWRPGRREGCSDVGSHTMRQSFSRRSRTRRPSYWRWPMPPTSRSALNVACSSSTSTVRKVALVTRRSSRMAVTVSAKPAGRAVDDRGHGGRVEPLPGLQVRRHLGRRQPRLVVAGDGRTPHRRRGARRPRRRPAVSPSRSTLCPPGPFAEPPLAGSRGRDAMPPRTTTLWSGAESEKSVQA